MQDIRWADLVLVMESKHKARLAAEFPRDLLGKSIRVLDVPDEYKYMDPELIDHLRQAVGGLFDDPEPS